MKHLLLALAVCATSVSAADNDGFVSMFNGKDLTGWTNINCAPETWTVKDGNIHCTGRPVGALRTLRHYENFIMEAEWRHLSSGGNSGIFMWGTPISAPGVPFLRGIEVQVLDHGYATQYEKANGKKSDWFTTHGDVFPIHGATMKPFSPNRGDRSFPKEERSKPSPEWNHYRIVASNGVIRLSVNGKEVSGGENCNYRMGYLALESEGAPVEFRNIRIKELPSSNPDPKLIAPLDPGWMPLYNGLDLRGWREASAAKSRWSANGWQLALKSGTNAVKQNLLSEREYGDAEFTLDISRGKEGVPALFVRGAEISLADAPAGKWTRVTVTSKGTEAVVHFGGKEVRRVTIPGGRGSFGIKDSGFATTFGNLHVREL